MTNNAKNTLTAAFAEEVKTLKGLNDNVERNLTYLNRDLGLDIADQQKSK